ncbi:MAG: DnaJ domain-containing protein [Candidatus Adiutrix sp.]|jgi:DnaJ-class molecular chaperone|nr:DnaJ domain-containing protein [Candidatus Adiutrix sp.]
MNKAAYRHDLHAVLGVDEKAGPEELRRAYLALAVKYHPDRNPDDPAAEERFKDVSQAYAILSDPAARARYERLRPKTGPRRSGAASSPGSSAGASSERRNSGQAADQAAGTSARPGPSAGSAAGSSGQSSSAPESEGREPDFDEILSEFFKSDKGRDTLRDLEGALNKAGLKFRMEDFGRWFKDRRQSADRSRPQPSFMERLRAWLPGAKARARRETERQEISYQLSISPAMAASGTIVEISYLRDGAPHRLKVKIPAGAQSGTRLRLGGQGRLRPDGRRGDLILTILVAQAPSVADLWK